MTRISPEAEKVNQVLDGLLFDLNDAMIILEDFKEEQREDLYKTLQQIIDKFQSLDNLAPTLPEKIPMDVIRLLDQGKDPSEFAKNLVDSVNQARERVKEKQRWMRHLKDSLDSLIELNFPGEHEEE